MTVDIHAHEIRERQADRQRIQADIDRFLDSGKMIEVLGSTPQHKPHAYNNDYRKELRNGR